VPVIAELNHARLQNSKQKAAHLLTTDGHLSTRMFETICESLENTYLSKSKAAEPGLLSIAAADIREAFGLRPSLLAL